MAGLLSAAFARRLAGMRRVRRVEAQGANTEEAWQAPLPVGCVVEFFFEDHDVVGAGGLPADAHKVIPFRNGDV